MSSIKKPSTDRAVVAIHCSNSSQRRAHNTQMVARLATTSKTSTSANRQPSKCYNRPPFLPPKPRQQEPGPPTICSARRASPVQRIQPAVDCRPLLRAAPGRAAGNRRPSPRAAHARIPAKPRAWNNKSAREERRRRGGGGGRWSRRRCVLLGESGKLR